MRSVSRFFRAPGAEGRALQVLRLAAALALGTGVVLSAGTALRQRGVKRQIAARAADAERLAGLVGEASRRRAALLALERVRAATPPELAGLVRAAWPNAEADIREGESAEALGGWSVRRTAVGIQAGAVEGLGRFLASAEAARPPWRMAEVSIVMLKERPGYAKITMSMESLCRDKR